MRLYDGSCQSEDLLFGMLDCPCRDCCRMRLLRVEAFIEADKVRRSMWPAISYDESGDIVVYSREETVFMKEQRHA